MNKFGIYKMFVVCCASLSLLSVAHVYGKETPLIVIEDRHDDINRGQVNNRDRGFDTQDKKQSDSRQQRDENWIPKRYSDENGNARGNGYGGGYGYGGYGGVYLAPEQDLDPGQTEIDNSYYDALQHPPEVP